jgi:oxygen-independent coproporphyrinogen-3 oxidase
VRQVRHKQPKHYLEAVGRGTPLAEDAIVAREDVGFEFMLNALRLTDGVPARCSPGGRTGFPLTARRA